jgi:folate-binding protein YgfZ
VEIAVPLAGLSELTAALDGAQLRAGDTSDWERLAIADGIPEIYPATMDEFIPQMVNLDTIGGVSFDKGCYPGQEIIARIRSRGSVKRHMQLAQTDAEAPRPGADIKDDAGKSVGNVVRSARNEKGSILLAVIADSALDSALSLPGNVLLSVIQGQQ